MEFVHDKKDKDDVDMDLSEEKENPEEKTQIPELNFVQIDDLHWTSQYQSPINLFGTIENWEIKISKSGRGTRYLQGTLSSPNGTQVNLILWSYQEQQPFDIPTGTAIILCNVTPKFLGDKKYVQIFSKSVILHEFRKDVWKKIKHKCKQFAKQNINKQNCMFAFNYLILCLLYSGVFLLL